MKKHHFLLYIQNPTNSLVQAEFGGMVFPTMYSDSGELSLQQGIYRNTLSFPLLYIQNMANRSHINTYGCIYYSAKYAQTRSYQYIWMYAIPYYCAEYDESLTHQRIWMYHNFLIPILLCRIWRMPFISRHLDVCHSLLYIQNMRSTLRTKGFGCRLFPVPIYICEK